MHVAQAIARVAVAVNEYQLGFRMVQQDTDGLAARVSRASDNANSYHINVFDGFGEYVDHDYAG